MKKHDSRSRRKETQFKVVESQRSRTDYPRREHQEEYGTEIMPPYSMNTTQDRSEQSGYTAAKDVNTGKAVGYVGLVIGIFALFMWSVILGPIAAVTGYYSFAQGSRTLGAWGIGLGLIATVSYFVLIPFAR
ncbi:hypothetical protein ACH6EH_09925 [Paenibacillus sp. JSM ZJ436]|uniref:hypothetical protein n=1 Tax=Paenibacillus sp. JSM ZJ436 TaxID=3376190 RepID=UPI003794E64A